VEDEYKEFLDGQEMRKHSIQSRQPNYWQTPNWLFAGSDCGKRHLSGRVLSGSMLCKGLESGSTAKRGLPWGAA
jgi:hypothetical protein